MDTEGSTMNWPIRPRANRHSSGAHKQANTNRKTPMHTKTMIMNWQVRPQVRSQYVDIICGRPALPARATYPLRPKSSRSDSASAIVVDAGRQFAGGRKDEMLGLACVRVCRTTLACAYSIEPTHLFNHPPQNGAIVR